MSSSYSSPKEVDLALTTLRATFASGKTKDLRFRKWQLKQLYWLVEDNADAVCDALAADLGKHRFESLGGDVGGVKKDILEHIEHLEEWTADEDVRGDFAFSTLGRTYLRKEPLGTVLIIGAWNFPFLLVISPLTAAIAAGCTALLKPSEVASNVEKLLVELIPKYLDSSAYAVVTGGAQETGYILSQKFNHIFFTGSTPVAKHIAAAAAKHLTPTVLELGGQAPAIVTKTANIDLAAKRIVAVKHMNAGQICLSANHVFVDPAVHDEFTKKANHYIKQFLGDKVEGMTHIINERNYDRLKGALDKTNGTIVTDGTFDRTDLKMPVTIIDDVKIDDSLLSAELFGPLLPVITADYHQAVSEVNKLPNPLGLYIFSNSQAEIDYILNHTLSGGVTINDCLIHAGAPNTPFGGVGDSGQGAYHGKYGVEAFTHKRAVVQLPNYLDRAMGFRYPPYDLEKNRGKVLVKNRLGFKRGERWEDQRVGGGKIRADLVRLAACVLAAAVVASGPAGVRPSWLQGWLDGVVGSLGRLLTAKA